MSLRPRAEQRSVEASPRSSDQVYAHAQNVVYGATAGRRTANGLRPVIFERKAAATGAFVSVPDTKEHEDLARRVAELEALFGRFSTGYKSFEGTYRAQVAQMTEFNTRLAAVEQKCERMSSDIKLLTDKVAGMDRADLRVETLLSNMQSELARLRSEMQRHQRNQAMHAHEDDERYEPKGFQQNDQPARFMGGGRM
jgi:hypothetical protein